jgi:hypothetical protein
MRYYLFLISYRCFLFQSLKPTPNAKMDKPIWLIHQIADQLKSNIFRKFIADGAGSIHSGLSTKRDCFRRQPYFLKKYLKVGIFRNQQICYL